MSDEVDRPLSGEEAAELDAAIAEVNELRQKFPIVDLPLNPFSDGADGLTIDPFDRDIFRPPDGEIHSHKPLASKQGLAPRTAVQLIDNALDMLEVARGTITTTGEAKRYRAALRALQVDRKAAWSSALDLTAPRYVISADLRAQADYLNAIHAKLEKDATALATIATALNGAAKLIKALNA